MHLLYYNPNYLNNCSKMSIQLFCTYISCICLKLTPLPLSFLCVCAAELEFVQIVIIIVVMTVMVVVIICLLNHYKLSTWSFITRQSQARRHDHALQQVSTAPSMCLCARVDERQKDTVCLGLCLVALAVLCFFLQHPCQ